MLYLVYCESTNYCGYGQHFVVRTDVEVPDHELEFLVSDVADEYFYEQDSDQLEEEGIEEGPYFSVRTIEPFDETHETWKFYKDPSQSEFYIEVNF